MMPAKLTGRSVFHPGVFFRREGEGLHRRWVLQSRRLFSERSRKERAKRMMWPSHERALDLTEPAYKGAGPFDTVWNKEQKEKAILQKVVECMQIRYPAFKDNPTPFGEPMSLLRDYHRDMVTTHAKRAFGNFLAQTVLPPFEMWRIFFRSQRISRRRTVLLRQGAPPHRNARRSEPDRRRAFPHSVRTGKR